MMTAPMITAADTAMTSRRWTISPTNSSTVPHAATNGQIDGPETRMTSSG